MPEPYDINAIFAEMEMELLASYRRNMYRHSQEEVKAGFSWEMWQSKKIADLQTYKRESRQIINKYANRAVHASSGIIVDNYKGGKNAADTVIRRFKLETDAVSFGGVDRRKMDALVDAVKNDFEKASSAALRLVDDQFRQIAFKTQVAYAAGSKTLATAIDSAASDFLSNGINSVLYSNGSRMNIASYSEMVMRTSAKRAYLTGEGARNNELGISQVQITSYGGCSPLCQQWQGRVYIDDVYSGGKSNGSMPLLSTAMAGGLFHPNCRHTSQPYFEGISTPAQSTDEVRTQEVYKSEQRQREIERNIRKYKRTEAGSVDEANRAKAKKKVAEWQAAMRQHLRENKHLSRKSYREK